MTEASKLSVVAVNELSSLDTIFNVTRSGLNLVAGSVKNGTAKVKSLQWNFLPERIIKVWNKLPYDVRSSTTVQEFKVNQENFKQEFIEDVGSENEGYFWRVSTIVIL